MKKHGYLFAVWLAALGAASAAAALPAASQTLPVTFPSEIPIKKTGPIPYSAYLTYPVKSVEKGEEGTVVLSVLVAPGGRIAKVKVIESSGYERLDAAAIRAVRKSRFDTQAWVDFRSPVTFSLADDMKERLIRNEKPQPFGQAADTNKDKRQPNP